MAEREKGWIYWRYRGGDKPRAYADFRDYSGVGGGQWGARGTAGNQRLSSEDERLPLRRELS